MDLEFYNSFTKGLKLKFGKCQALLQINVEVTGEKLVRKLFRKRKKDKSISKAIKIKQHIMTCTYLGIG